ncbi:valine--tRNA ligase [Methylocella sp.]|uniref:valine--tRNA ligase n=1 Tax=Methylocella sp. TaxID=1978226 RepID=UPI0035B43EA9
MMDKTFDPGAVEGRVAALWRRTQAFRAGRPDRAGGKPFSLVIPPPNVTGSLHMGHALNATLQDALARYRRMRGDDVLWQPGTDHAGIATQMVVERRLAADGEPGRRVLGRAKFLERVWEWKAESGGVIVEQLKRLGASCDWSRERFTMDEGLSKAVVKVFVELHRAGLIYRDKRLVNWDPRLLTAISDLEVAQIETQGHLWRFKYPVGDAEGRETGAFVTVATTRPETMLGDAAVAVNPDDARYLHLHGARVRLPLVGRLIPIVADAYSDPEKGTGAVKITPAHDFNDFEVGRRHGLPLINVFDAEARLQLHGNEAFLRDASPEEETLRLDGSFREAARERIVEMMEARGLLEGVDAHPHMVPHGDRSGVAVEPWLTDQWYVDARTLAKPALEAVREGRTAFHPRNWEKTYFDWLENIEPWCVSRQLWWGHQIPAWRAPDGKFFVAMDEAQAQTQADAHYGAPTPLKRDEDVLDTWFSSALWPFSTLGWPDKTPELERYYPTSVLVTGFDIIFFWVARMMMMGLHFTGEVPFRDVYLHALVRDAKGAKMSKSKGNVIDPIELVDEYGADCLRFALAAMAAQGRDVKLSKERVEGYRNFATKIWNAARFSEINGCALVPGFDPRGVKETLNAWILGEAARAASEVEEALEAYRFNDAAGAAYRFVWNVFCDWHLELAKPLLQGEDGPAKDETRATTAFVFDQILKILHPFMPFLTEELWAQKAPPGAPRAAPLALSAWPDLKGLEAPQAEAEIGWLVELISEIRSVRSEMNAPAGAQMPLVLVAPSPEVEARARRFDETLRRLARLSGVSFAAEAPPESAQALVRGELAALPLAGVIDFAAEKARLAKEIGKSETEAKKLAAKLANADFVARAPEEVVEENRERLAEARARAEKLAGALARLG